MYENFKVYEPLRLLDTNSIETLGEVNYISRSLIDGQVDGGMINMDILPFEKKWNCEYKPTYKLFLEV